MSAIDKETPPVAFKPIVLDALYTASDRGLTADVLAARALGGIAFPVCTTIVVAGGGRVTDVLDVPTDTVDAQLEHLFTVTAPNAARVGIISNARTTERAFHRLKAHLQGPIVFDLTLSGPDGEDLANERATEALVAGMAEVTLVTISRTDAELIARMEIKTLDDAQVAVQRLHRLGAGRVLLRCGALPSRFFEPNGATEAIWQDLYFDGDEFAVFEAPLLTGPDRHGLSGALSLAVLSALHENRPILDALQFAKAYVTEALRRADGSSGESVPAYFWQWQPPSPSTPV